MKMKMEMSTAAAVGEKEKKVDATHGPLQEYESRVEAGLLRDDDHQRGRHSHFTRLLSIATYNQY